MKSSIDLTPKVFAALDILINKKVAIDELLDCLKYGDDALEEYNNFAGDNSLNEEQYTLVMEVINYFLNKDKKTSSLACPYCGKSHFTMGPTISTCLYSPTVVKEGKVISKDPNSHTTQCHCLECDKDFLIVNGKVKDAH